MSHFNYFPQLLNKCSKLSKLDFGVHFLVKLIKSGLLSDNKTCSQCLKITQNVAFEFFNYGIFHQFLSY